MEVIWAKTLIWGFKQSFLSSGSLKVFNDLLAPKSYFLPKYPPNVTTQTPITFHEKIFENFFWSHGAPLGYLGSLSQKRHPEIFSKCVLINLSNPLRHPAPLVDPLLTINLDTVGPWCSVFSCTLTSIDSQGLNFLYLQFPPFNHNRSPP